MGGINISLHTANRDRQEASREGDITDRELDEVRRKSDFLGQKAKMTQCAYKGGSVLEQMVGSGLGSSEAAARARRGRKSTTTDHPRKGTRRREG